MSSAWASRRSLGRAGTAVALMVLLSMSLAAQVQPTPQPDKVADLEWVDAETGETIFRGNDLIAFDWDKQVMWLDEEAAMDLITWMSGGGFDGAFVLKDRDGVIYRGHWVSGASSRSFGGPVLGSGPYEAIQAPLISIGNGYPAGGADDQRFSPRFHERLQEAGLLKTIDPKHPPSPLGMAGTDPIWFGGEKKIRATFFTSTIRPGKQARVLLLFSGGPEELWVPGRTLVVTFNLISYRGTFRSTTTLPPIPAEKVRYGQCDCRFDPWTPLPGFEKYNPNNKYADYDGYVSVDVALKDATTGKVVGAWVVPPQRLNF